MFQSKWLVFQGLKYYWKTHLAVLLGVLVGTAVIVGAMVVGDSVKASLRQMTLDRLGQIDLAMSGWRFFREELANDIAHATEAMPASKTSSEFAPAILMQAGLQSNSKSAIRRASQIQVYGLDQRGWNLVDTEKTTLPDNDSLILNVRAAEAISARVGDQVTLWVELPSLVPRDTLMGNKDNDSEEITLTVSQIAPDTSGLGRLGLLPTQMLPMNAFVNLSLLQERLGFDRANPSRRDPTGKPARINAILAHRQSEAFAQAATRTSIKDALHESLTMADFNLRLTESTSSPALVLDSDQMFLEDRLARTAQKTADRLGISTAPVMVYLANKIWNPQISAAGKRSGYSMYSTVAGIELFNADGSVRSGWEFEGAPPAQWQEGDVVINEFLANDLQAKVGDQIRFNYHKVGSRGELPELEQTMTVRGILKMSGLAIDRTLTPEVKGITDVNSLADWDQPFPMDLDAVTPRDDEYWDKYRAVPKLFLPLKTAQALWPSRYGTLTSIRLTPSTDRKPSEATADLKAEFSQELLKQMDPAEFGLAFQPVKALGLKAASGSTDFAGLFFGFSLFLIVAALILIGLLFRLGIEQRVRDLGLLGAIGFTARQVRRQMLVEGAFVALLGAILGTFAGIAYAQLMIYGLTHWWIGAIGTNRLQISIQPTSLFTGFAIAFVAAVLSIAWALRQLKSLSLREQLAGVTEKEVNSIQQANRAKRNFRRAAICLILSLVMASCTALGYVPVPGGFFGIGVLLLVAALSLLSAWLRSEPGVSFQGNGRRGFWKLTLRNASRQRQRTIMTAGMIATATFLIVTVAAFRQDPTGDAPKKRSGNGGYTLVAETTSPVLYDLNTPEGRKKLQLNAAAGSADADLLSKLNVVPIRVRPGEDASCLNLYQTTVPKILGVPQSLIDDQRFLFASGSWSVLNQELPPTKSSQGLAPIPVIGDMNTLMYSLHKQVGQTVAIPNDQSPEHELMIRGMLQDSVFQGVLVMSEENFLKLFPEQKGFRYFLIEAPLDEIKAAESFLETELAEYGFDAEPVGDRLARFLSVQNTYLSTFQTLGGLGLLLGTFGLATVMLRNILERQSELALLRAIGFRKQSVAMLVLYENACLLIWGLAAGFGATVLAILATTPARLMQDSGLPWGALIGLMVAVFGTGMLASIFAVRTAIQLPIVTTLRGE